MQFFQKNNFQLKLLFRQAKVVEFLINFAVSFVNSNSNNFIGIFLFAIMSGRINCKITGNILEIEKVLIFLKI